MSNRAEVIYTAGRMTTAQEITPAEVQAFVGGMADHYLEMWEPVLSRESSHAGFNWAGLVLGPAWLLYRKLYPQFWFFFGLSALIGYLADAMGSWLAEMSILLLVAFPCGIQGNVWYLEKALRAIGQVRGLNCDEETRLRVLADRGGIFSLWGIALVLILQAGIVAVLLR